MVRFLGKMRNVLKRMRNQFLRFLFFELLIILFTIFKVFSTKNVKMMLSLENVLCSDRSFSSPEFFVRLLVFELWSILYSTIVNSELGKRFLRT